MKNGGSLTYEYRLDRYYFYSSMTADAKKHVSALFHADTYYITKTTDVTFYAKITSRKIGLYLTRK